MAGGDAAATSNLHWKRGCHGCNLPGQPAESAGGVESTHAYRRGDLWAARGHSCLRSCRTGSDHRPGRAGPSQLQLRTDPTPLSPVSNLPTCQRSVSEDLDVGTEGIEPVGQVLITPVDDVDVSQHRLSARREHAEEDAHR